MGKELFIGSKINSITGNFEKGAVAIFDEVCLIKKKLLKITSKKAPFY